MKGNPTLVFRFRDGYKADDFEVQAHILLAPDRMRIDHYVDARTERIIGAAYHRVRDYMTATIRRPTDHTVKVEAFIAPDLEINYWKNFMVEIIRAADKIDRVSAEGRVVVTWSDAW